MAFHSPAEFDVLWEKSFNSGDADGVLCLYSADAVIVPEPGVRVQGHEGIRAVVDQFLAAAPASVSFLGSSIIENGETAVLFTPWTASITGPEGPIPMEGNATVVLHKGADGWLAVIDDFYSKS